MTRNHKRDTEVVGSALLFIQEKTLLCRWDKGRSVSEEITADDDVSISSLGLWDDDDDDADFALPRSKESRAVKPQRGARRSFYPPRARECREASKESGVDIGSVALVPVLFPSRGRSMSIMGYTASLNQVLKLEEQKHASNQVTAVFCIGRAGCGSCRIQGRQLARISKKIPSLNLFGIVKKSNFTNDKDLCEFYNRYFPFPIYRDEKWETFQFLGNRKISMWKALTKDPQNKLLGGDHFLQGGILLFDRKGELRHVYYERYGDELDVKALTWAIQDCLSHH